MPLSGAITPGKIMQANEKSTNAKLNQGFNPTVAISGQTTTAQTGDKTVTPIKSAPGAWFWGTDTGGASAHVVTLDSGPCTYVTGLIVAYRPATTGMGGALTVNVDTQGVKSIKLASGQDPVAGDIRAGAPIHLRYDGTNFVLVSPVVNDPARVVTSAGAANVQTVTFGGTTGYATVTALKTGIRVAFKAGFTITGALTLNVDGLGAKKVLKNGGSALVDSDIASGQFVQCIYDETADSAAGAWLMISPTVTTVPVTVVADARNLVTKPNTGTPNTKADVTADAVILKTASGLSYLAENVSVTIDITQIAVANGLDTGAAANGTWYYIWLIYNGTTVAGLFSTSSTAPTLPTGYTYKALVGVVRDSGAAAEGAAAGAFVPWYQHGRRIWLQDINLFTNLFNATSLTTWNSISGTASKAVQLSVLIPTIAKRVFGTMGSNDSGATIEVAADANALGAVTCVAWCNGNSINSFLGCTPFEVSIVTAQDFYWRGYAATSHNKINISGYEI